MEPAQPFQAIPPSRSNSEMKLLLPLTKGVNHDRKSELRAAAQLLSTSGGRGVIPYSDLNIVVLTLQFRFKNKRVAKPLLLDLDKLRTDQFMPQYQVEVTNRFAELEAASESHTRRVVAAVEGRHIECCKGHSTKRR